MKPFFIIITASYNRPELLQRNIEAMLAQTCDNWHQIIVDDGSEAAINPVLENAEKQAAITVLRNNGNQGCNKTRNRALDYIAEQGMEGFVSFVDDDDYMPAEALEKVSNLIAQCKGYHWYTTDCCFDDGSKASRIKHYGELSYLQDYMLGKVIRGDLHHFINSEACRDVRFTEAFRNGQEWYFFCLLAADNKLWAFDYNAKIIRYLPEGLSGQKVNSRNKLAVAGLKVQTLAPLVTPYELTSQQLPMVREMIKAGNAREALPVLKQLWPYRWLSLRFYRYAGKAILQSLLPRQPQQGKKHD